MKSYILDFSGKKLRIFALSCAHDIRIRFIQNSKISDMMYCEIEKSKIDILWDTFAPFSKSMTFYYLDQSLWRRVNMDPMILVFLP